MRTTLHDARKGVPSAGSPTAEAKENEPDGLPSELRRWSEIQWPSEEPFDLCVIKRFLDGLFVNVPAPQALRAYKSGLSKFDPSNVRGRARSVTGRVHFETIFNRPCNHTSHFLSHMPNHLHMICGDEERQKKMNKERKNVFRGGAASYVMD